MINEISAETNLCEPKIVVSASRKYAVQAESIISFLDATVSQGGTFSSGQTIQFGSVLLKLLKGDSGKLEVWEPDFMSMPVGWTKGVDNTLRFTLIQREVCARVGVDPEFPAINHSGVVSSTFDSGTGSLMMVREGMHRNDSGWLFRRVESESLEARLQSLYEIILSQTHIIPFLALPPGSEVIQSDVSIQIRFADKLVSSDDDDFLRQMAGSLPFKRGAASGAGL